MWHRLSCQQGAIVAESNNSKREGVRSRRFRRAPIALVCVLFAVLVLVGVTGRFVPANSNQAPVHQQGSAQDSVSELQQQEPGSAEGEIITIAHGEDGITVEHEAGVVMVQLAEGASAADLSEALSRLDIVRDPHVSEGDIALGYVDVRLAEGVSVPDAMQQLAQLAVVQDTQPNFVYHLVDDGEGADLQDESADASGSLAAGAIDEMLEAQSTTINDTDADKQWALKSIEAFDAWDKVKARGRVTVAVVDTGCNTTHEDLKNNIVQAYDATGYGSIADNDGHGTHVCGVVAAEANNAKGVAGVSYNAQLLPIKVFVGKNASVSALTRAYQFIQNNASFYNIRVINLSIGLTVDNKAELNNLDRDKALYNAVKKLRDENGILTVCSAGNEADKQHGAYLNFPGDYLDTAMNVIALRQDGNNVVIADYSNYNMSGQKTKDISAPGSSIYSTYNLANKKYTYLSGTSMAAPCVSGIAALLFAANPDLTPVQVQDILHNSTVDLGSPGWDETYGYGEVNAKNAVSEARLGLFLDGDSSVLKGGYCALTPSAAGPWTWASSDPAVARVSSGGTVTGVKGGQAVITATRADGKKVSRTITVYDISFSGSHQVYAGETTTLKFNENPNTGMWLIGADNESIAKTQVSGDVTVSGVRTGTTTVTAKLASNNKLKVSWNVTVLPQRIDFSQATVSMSGWTYDGKAHNPAVTVRLNGTTLPASAYRVAYSGNVNVGTCRATVTPTDSSKYKNTATGTCTVAPASLSGAELSLSETSYVYDGAAKTPTVTVRLDGRTLVSGSDYMLEYSGSTGVGTATATATGVGNYTGAKSAQYEITSPGFALWTRVSGETALDTMRAIVDEGWSGVSGNAVVLTTADGYWDALTAAGIAGMAKAPVLMTETATLSAQTQAVISSLRPATIVVCGGTAAVTDDVVQAAASAAGGAKVVRCWGETATGTAVDAFKKAPTGGMGRWAHSAFVCTNDGYWDALAAAPISYARSMPIFLTEGASDISSETISAMWLGGVSSVYIVGGTAAIDDAVVAKLSAAGIRVKDRLAGETAVETSEAVAQFGLSQDMTCARMGVATTNGYWDALSGAALCGLYDSVLVLAADENSQSISSFVHSHKSEIVFAYVFGGEAALDAATYAALQNAVA